MLRRIRELGVDTLVPGHGPVARPAALDMMADYIEDVRAVARRMRNAGEPVDAAATQPVPDARADWRYGRFFAPNVRAVYQTLAGER